MGGGDSPGEGKGYPLQYSGLENSMDYTWVAELVMTERFSLHFGLSFVMANALQPLQVYAFFQLSSVSGKKESSSFLKVSMKV